MGTGIPCTGCVSHTGYFAHGKRKGEVRRRNIQQNNGKRVVRMKEMNVGTKKNSPKQGLTSVLSKGAYMAFH